MTICESVNEIRWIVVNITQNLCCGGLQEVEHLKVVLMEDKVAYCESVGGVGLSTSIQGPSMIIPSLSMRILGPSICLGDIGSPHTYTDITDSFSNWTSWGDTLDTSKSACLSMSWGDY